MERVRFINYRGKRILFNDFSGLSDSEEAMSAIERCRELVAAEPPDSLLTLTFVREANLNGDVTQALKQLAADNKPHVKAAAIAGENTLQRVVLQVVEKFSGRNMAHCDRLMDAKEWLVQQQ